MLYQLSLFFIALLIVSPLNAQDPGKAAMLSGDQSPPLVLQSVLGAEVACVNDVAAGYPCSSVNLSSFLSVADISDALNSGSVETNDIWGWTDPETGVEYALLGMNNGTAFIDVSDAENPQPVGFLPTHTTSSIWRDIKVYNNHAFIVADAAGSHGVQIYDLTQLRSITTPQTLENTSHYDGIASAHNIAINEESGFAYVVGSRGGGQTCNSSLHMVDISNPLEPSFAGCFFDLQTGGVVAVGYTHDVQCVNYNGPDTEHAGKEICIGSNERAISIADVTDKSNPVALSRGTYPEASYIHQGWLSEDHRYFFQDDELDERNLGTTTRTIVWDLEDLDDPVIVANLDSEVSSIDHNQYVKDNVLYQSNYSSGVRIWDVRDPLNPVFAGFFDTYPSNNNTGFVGTWSNYPFFESGIVIASGIDEGLFVLNPELNLSVAVEEAEVPASMDVTPPYPNPVTQSIISLQVKSSQDDAIQVEIVDMTGRVVGTRLYKALTPNTPVNLSIDTSTLPNGNYLVRVTGNSETKVYPIAILD